MTKVDEYREWLAKGKRQATIQAYVYWYKKMLEQTGGDTKACMKKFYEDLPGVNGNPRHMIRAMINSVCEYKAIKPPKLRKDQIRTNHPLPKYLGAKEIRQVIEAFENERPKYADIPKLMYFCGLRISEAVSIKKEDIKELEGSIIIEGKGGHQRIVYPPSKLVSALLRRGEFKDKYCYPSPVNEGAHIHPETIRYYFRTLEGVPPGATPHKLRHSFATSFLKQGANIRQIQDALGHKSIETTSIYTHVYNAEVKAEMKKLQDNYYG